jgi:putative DNA methylase
MRNRKAAKEFVTKLCRYPKTDPSKPEDIKIKRETEAAIVEAQKHILEAHADRLTRELADAKKTGNAPPWVEEFKFKGERVAYEDIVAGCAPRPRVLDMFGGGGAIPLEALRLGCEAYALDLNPVAHIIQLCTLVYPQKYGKSDPTARGMTGPENAKGETTWGGLAAEVRYWGNWVWERVRKEIGDLYPTLEVGFTRCKAATDNRNLQSSLFANEPDVRDQTAPTTPIAYFWTRAVECKNPSCRAMVRGRSSLAHRQAKSKRGSRRSAPLRAWRI